MVTQVPTVVNGDDFTEDFTLATRDAVTELQDLTATLAEVSPSGVSGFTLMSSIPQTFRHLVIVGSLRHNNESGGSSELRRLGLRFNGDTGSNYHYVMNWRTFNGTTGNANSSGGEVGFLPFGEVGSLRCAFRVDIPNYTVASTARLIRASARSGAPGAPDARWRTIEALGSRTVSEPVEQINLLMSGAAGDLFDAASMVSLYGLA